MTRNVLLYYHHTFFISYLKTSINQHTCSPFQEKRAKKTANSEGRLVKYRKKDWDFGGTLQKSSCKILFDKVSIIAFDSR
ncbi:protein of unknown function [Legionella fallonii LLAP-10]|uniref:Uncharacterized protein n=1 Tax=Legionella fallonii LLAP-10 TaxID=1212491 RepID=A0A098G5Q8_9GAMM|nr:protein of unknown function [Legionella fallonii LLAP-10]